MDLKQTEMKVSAQRRRSFSTKAILLFIGVVLPFVLSQLVSDPRIDLLPLFLAPTVLIGLWTDLGFILGFFVFWGTMIVIGQESRAPGQVDNLIPVLMIFFGWVPYLVFFGPVFLVLKVTERIKLKRAEIRAAKHQSTEV